MTAARIVFPSDPRVLTYSRVSTSHHDQKPEVQTSQLRKYTEARGWKIAYEIIDHGYSGSTDNRPGLRQLMQLARSREVDVIVCLKMDRLFRSLKHLVTALEEFEQLGITFIAVADGVDWSTAQGKLFAQILGSLAEFEKALLIERTRMGLEYARSQGKTLGRPKKRDDEAIRRLKAQGKSHREIWEALGVSKGSVWRALRNPKSGDVVLQKTTMKLRKA